MATTAENSHNFFRPAVDAMTGYIPGEQPKPGTSVIKLNTNENPYPPSPQALAVLQNFDPDALRRYPHPYAQAVQQAVSEVFGVPSDWVLVGNGSDEVLNLVIRACAEGRQGIAYPTPTYVLYPTLAQIQPADVIEIPYPEDCTLPIAELVAAQAAVTFIASPNSPTGHSVPLADLRELAAKLSGVLVVDEAYVDFAEFSALPLVQEFANVLICRTLSKGYSLAGLRLGFGIAQPSLLAGLFKIKDSYNIDAIASAVGAAAIRDQAYKNQCAEQVKASRRQLTESLRQLGFDVPESQTNFLWAKPPQPNTDEIYAALKEQGILVRYFPKPGLNHRLRITVGTAEQNQALLTALQPLV